LVIQKHLGSAITTFLSIVMQTLFERLLDEKDA